jgi:hypothetical membrane protein
MLTPLVALIGIAYAILISPWFSFDYNALSDLGISAAANIFNATLIITGIMSTVFATGMFGTFRQNSVKRIGAAVFIVASVVLICIGILHEGYSPHHYIASVLFFVLMPVSILIISIPMTVKPDTRNLGFLSLVVVIIAIIAWVIPWGMGIAVPEAIAVIAGCIWIIVMGMRVYLGSDAVVGK